MQGKIEIEHYFDGYKSSDINCIDIPIAACAGYFKRDYYFLYCFCYCYFFNWSGNVGKDWLYNREIIMNILDLYLVPIKIESDKELLPCITRLIDSKMPILMIVKYGALFYSDYYKWGEYDHGLIISDYDDEREVVGIRDREVVRYYINNGIFSSDIFHRLQIDYDTLINIWNKSNQMFKIEKSNHFYYLYAIKSNNIKQYIDIKQLFIKLKECNNNNFLNRLSTYISETDEKITLGIVIDRAEMENSRRIHCLSFKVLFDLVYNYLKERGIAQEKLIEINNKYSDFIDHRYQLFNLLQKNILSNSRFHYDKDIAKDTNLFLQFWKTIEEEILDY